jgi:hypothetical protein
MITLRQWVLPGPAIGAGTSLIYDSVAIVIQSVASLFGWADFASGRFTIDTSLIDAALCSITHFTIRAIGIVRAHDGYSVITIRVTVTFNIVVYISVVDYAGIIVAVGVAF